MSLLFRDDKELIREIRSKNREYYEENFNSWKELSLHFKIDIHSLKKKFDKACITFKPKKNSKNKTLTRMPSIEFTPEKAMAFYDAYIEALKKNEDKFIFDNTMVLVKYAKHVIEFLKEKGIL